MYLMLYCSFQKKNLLGLLCIPAQSTTNFLCCVFHFIHLLFWFGFLLCILLHVVLMKYACFTSHNFIIKRAAFEVEPCSGLFVRKVLLQYAFNSLFDFILQHLGCMLGPPHMMRP